MNGSTLAEPKLFQMKLLFLPMSQLIKTFSSAWVNNKKLNWNYDLLIASGGFGAYSAYAAHHASNLSPWRAYEGTFQGFQHHSSYGKKPVHLSIAHSIPSHSVPFIPTAWFRPRPAVTGAPSAHHKTSFPLANKICRLCSTPNVSQHPVTHSRVTSCC